MELKEIDISGNMIGKDCAQEIISALENRKEGKVWTSVYRSHVEIIWLFAGEKSVFDILQGMWNIENK